MCTGSDSEKEPLQPSTSPRRVRWWPVPVLLVLAVVAVIWVRWSYDRQFQDKNIATALVGVITSLLLLLWCLFFSRLKVAIRLGVFGAVVGVVVAFICLFRIHGVTGDLVPVWEWRWANKMTSVPTTQRPAVSSLMAGHTNDYPQFLGPNRNGIVTGIRLASDWKNHPPQRLWSQPVGTAWSGFAVAGHYAVTQEQRGENETVVCYDLTSGAIVWYYAYSAHFLSSLAGEGPRATPTISGGRVYALGSTGTLNALDLDTGKLVWTKNIVIENQSQTNEWGISCSPLVADDRVIISAGGPNNRSLVAYKADSGDFAWGAGSDGAGYSSPFAATLAGVKQILIFNSFGVCAHDVVTGKMLWKYKWPGGHPHVSTPIVLPQDRVLVSSGYGVGSELLQVKRSAEGDFTATRLWKSNRLKAKFTNLVYRDGYIYGLDDGIMVCLDAASGDLKWKEGRYGHGQEILAEDLLLVSAESGQMILMEPNPEGSRELGRFSALSQKTWNPPALAGEYLVWRNDKEAACYRLPIR